MTSKYDRLADHLAAIEGATITLTFGEAEAVVGPLPLEARRRAEWWDMTGRARYVNAHTLKWWHAGSVADRPDFVGETVTFRRIAG